MRRILVAVATRGVIVGLLSALVGDVLIRNQSLGLQTLGTFVVSGGLFAAALALVYAFGFLDPNDRVELGERNARP